MTTTTETITTTTINTKPGIETGLLMGNGGCPTSRVLFEKYVAEHPTPERLGITRLAAA